jgi:hypothetical protein
MIPFSFISGLEKKVGWRAENGRMMRLLLYCEVLGMAISQWHGFVSSFYLFLLYGSLSGVQQRGESFGLDLARRVGGEVIMVWSGWVGLVVAGCY